MTEKSERTTRGLAIWRLNEYILIFIIFTLHDFGLTQHGISPHHRALTLYAILFDTL